MNEIKDKIRTPHSVLMKDRGQLSLSGVTDVDSFDESAIIAYTDYGELTVRGNRLHISQLNIESGELNIDGEISSLTYLENQPKAQSFLAKVFR